MDFKHLRQALIATTLIVSGPATAVSTIFAPTRRCSPIRTRCSAHGFSGAGRRRGHQ